MLYASQETAQRALPLIENWAYTSGTEQRRSRTCFTRKFPDRFFNISREGDTTATQGSPVPVLCHPRSEGEFPHVYMEHLLCSSWCPLPLVLLLGPTGKSPIHLTPTLQIFMNLVRSALSSLLQEMPFPLSCLALAPRNWGQEWTTFSFCLWYVMCKLMHKQGIIYNDSLCIYLLIKNVVLLSSALIPFHSSVMLTMSLTGMCWKESLAHTEGYQTVCLQLSFHWILFGCSPPSG